MNQRNLNFHFRPVSHRDRYHLNRKNNYSIKPKTTRPNPTPVKRRNPLKKQYKKQISRQESQKILQKFMPNNSITPQKNIPKRSKIPLVVNESKNKTNIENNNFSTSLRNSGYDFKKQLSPLKKKVLNCFEQNHIIEIFNNFNDKQRENLEDDLELLELDMIDLVKKNINFFFFRITII